MRTNSIMSELKKYFSWEESREDIILDHRLTNLYSEVREWEHLHGAKVSDAFEARVLSHLEDIEQDSQAAKRWIPAFLENRTIQYGMSFAMVCVLAVVLVTRSSGNFIEEPQETAGVIIENTDYLNQPSSVEYADSYHRRVFLESTKSQEGSVETLRQLENYFLATGKKGVASEIRYFIQESGR